MYNGVKFQTTTQCVTTLCGTHKTSVFSFCEEEKKAAIRRQRRILGLENYGRLCTGNVYLLAGTRRDRGYRCITVICLLPIVGHCLFCAFQYPFMVLALPTLLNGVSVDSTCSVVSGKVSRSLSETSKPVPGA